MPAVEFFKEILDHMSSGVMTLQMDAKIITFNPAAGELLGISNDSVVGRTFDEIFLLEMEGNDEFTQLILDAVYEPGTSHQKVVRFVRADGGEVWLSLKTSSLSEGDMQAVIVSFSDVTQIESLRAAEQDLNERLQKAYRELEVANDSLKAAVSRGRVVRRMAVGFGALLIVVVSVWLWFWSPDLHWWGDDAGGAEPGLMNTVGVASEPIQHLITLSGTIQPLEMINVVSPFEGRVLERHVKSGQTVVSGDLLMTLDSTELQTKVRDEKASCIKAEQRYEELNRWSNSMEMAQSRRRLVRAQNNLSVAEKKLTDSEYLFGKGIVSENELQDAKEHLRSRRMEVLSAREEVQSTQQKACDGNLEVARLEWQNAKRKYESSLAKLEQNVLFAPVSGVVLEAVELDKKRALPARGSVVSENELLLAIGNMEGLTVSTKVDEVDVGHLATGMAVRVTGDAFSDLVLDGFVSAVSSEARNESGQGASFDVDVVIPRVDDVLLERLRLGMSSTLDVLVYSRESALVVPVYAVASDGESWVAQVMSEEGDVEVRPVQVGITTLDAVEILEGLQEGEQVVVP